MCTLKSLIPGLAVLAALACVAAPATAQTAVAAQAAGYPVRFDFGATPTPAELAHYYSIPPDGRGLPKGRGTAADGAKIYAENCAACHGEKLEGIPKKGVGGDKLIGGRGTLASEAPVKTIESYWPYATTVFDFVKRAMPFQAPGSLSNDQIYAVVAYILAEANIIKKTDALDETSLARVQMPNRSGFIADPRPEIELYR